MINSICAMGIRVEDIHPKPYMVNVNVNSDIKITFNSDLDLSCINNVVIFKDRNMIFRNEKDLNNLNNFEIINGDTSYENKVITFKPKKPLEPNSRYIIIVKNIKNILNEASLSSYHSSFITELTSTIPKCIFLEPKVNKVSEKIPSFVWDKKTTKAYVFQISKQKDFETLMFDKVLENVPSVMPFNPNIKLDEGLYYVRVKALCGEWSDLHQFFIKKNECPVTKYDETELQEYEDIYNELEKSIDDLEILETYPENLALDIDTNLNCIYIKVKGKIETNDIDASSIKFTGSLYDEDDSDINTDEGYIIGSTNIIYNEIEDATYIIFNIKNNVLKGEYNV